MNLWYRARTALLLGHATTVAAPPLSAPSRVRANDETLAPRPLTWARVTALALPLGLFLVALAPRLMLARSLDLVTDEGVYIPVGQLDYGLLTSGHFASQSWLANIEAPPLPKLFIGLGATLGAALSPSSGWLIGARLPGVLVSALMLVVAYHLAKPIFGQLAATLGVLALALSPWISYFAALAYLDTYMLSFVTLAVLLTWHAARRPRLWPLVAVLLGLAFASKYTAALALIPMAGYLTYYYAVVVKRKPPRALLWSVVALLLTIYVADPTIWMSPIDRLWSSIIWQWGHASNGHLTFWNGRVVDHVPMGEGLFILLAKTSVFVTGPALLALPWLVYRVWGAGRAPSALDDRAAFALCWFGGLLIPFSMLTIVVGTHYMLPLAPPAAFVGTWALLRGSVWGLGRLTRFSLLLRRRLMRVRTGGAGTVARVALAATAWRPRPLRSKRVRVQLLVMVICLLVTAPPAYGLLTISQAEGYTSEWLPGENSSLQVAYPAYGDAIQWVVDHTHGNVTVALVALNGTLNYWMESRPQAFPQRVKLIVGTPYAVPKAQYVIWPEHLIQREFPTPPNWQHHIVQTINGGGTTYCYILRLSAKT